MDDTFLPFLCDACTSLCNDKYRAIATVGKELAYTFQIKHYDENDGPISAKESRYQTDVLILDQMVGSAGRGCWIPRVVIECKKNRVTTHDAITYSAKAATHKQVHPYMRYGFLIANFGTDPLPARLIKHGNNFDFIARWKGNRPSNAEGQVFRQVLREEIEASRRIQHLLEDRKTKNLMQISMLHRPLNLLKS